MIRYFLIVRDFFESLFLKVLSIFIWRNDKYIAIGSWWGDRFADNSRYLAEYICRNHRGYTVFWVGNPAIKKEVLDSIPNAVFLKKGSLACNIQLLKCKYMFFSQIHSADISSCNVYKGAITCYLHHGMPLKKLGQDGLNQSLGSDRWIIKQIQRVLGKYTDYDYFVTSSPIHDRISCSAFAFKGCNETRLIRSGTPRNDMYFEYSDIERKKYKDFYSEMLGFDPSKKVVMYLPTFRRTSTEVFSFTTLPDNAKDGLSKILEDNNFVLIEKGHVVEKNLISGESRGKIYSAPSALNVQEMMLFSDVLISDYSGAFLDYVLLDRPIIHYVYDYDYYKNIDSGLYFGIEEFYAGPIVYNYDDLIVELDKAMKGIDEFSERRSYIRNKFMSYETGKASEIIFKTITK